MNWVLKAKIQNALAYLPSSLSYEVHYWLQRKYGALKKMDPVSRFVPGVETWKRIKKCGQDPTGKTFFEIGTGRAPMVPLAYWLMGADRIVTMDINPYVREKLIAECLQSIAGNRQEIEKLFGSLLVRDRLDILIQYQERNRFTLKTFLELSCIEYKAPAKVVSTGLSSRSIDYHTSYNVLEHVLPEELPEMFQEGNRIVAGDGLFIHRIDYSDHFAQSDRTISALNFLQYSDADWSKYSENKYMYTNRMRHDDFLLMLKAIGHRIVADDAEMDQEARDLLRSGRLCLHDRFKGKSEDILSVTSAWIVSRKPDE